MADQKTFSFNVQLTAKELWLFSLYHSYKGLMGIFNVLFTIAALYVLIMNWPAMQVSQKVLMILCVLMFTVIQPSMLYLKAKRQSKAPMVKEPMQLVFSREAINIAQAGQEAVISCDQVGRVEGTPFMLIFYMDRVHAYLIPKALMGAEEGEFRALIRECLPKIRYKRV